MTPATPALVLTAFTGGLLLGTIWSPRCPRPRRPRPRAQPVPPYRRTWTEGSTQRGNGQGGPQSPRPTIQPRGMGR